MTGNVESDKGNPTDFNDNVIISEFVDDSSLLSRYENARSFYLHQAVLKKLLDDPMGVLLVAGDNLDRLLVIHDRKDSMARDYLLQWQDILESGFDSVVEVLYGVDERSCDLRVNSPFAGVLSDSERLLELYKFQEFWKPKVSE